MTDKKVQKAKEEKAKNVEEKNIDDTKSILGITVKKDDDFSEWYPQVIQKAEMIEYGPVSGCMVVRPYAYAIWETVQSFLDKEFKKSGVQNAYFPLLIPESLFKKEQEHVEGFTPEVAWVTEHGDTKFEERLAIRPTSETIMYDSYKKWIRSYRDLPLRLNQWCSVVRWEFKHPVPFLRTREFLWQEGHTVFATEEEAKKETFEILDIYARAYEELYAIPVMKGRKSDTEKFAGAVYSNSLEIFMPNSKAIQGCTTHLLGQNFAKAFDISFLDHEGKKQYAWQNSWGFTTRSIGIMVAMHGDDKGLVLPPRVAPIHVVIVPIVFSNKPSVNEKILELANNIKKELKTIKVHLDDRDEYSPGFKFNYWEMKGVPVRIEIGPKDLEKNHVVLVRRDTGIKESVPVAEIAIRVIKLLADIQDNLYDKAKKFLESSIEKTDSLAEIKKAIDSGKIAMVNWCGSAECEAKVKEETGAKSLNTPFKQQELKGNCFCGCGRKAEKTIYFARSY
ncbi:proline--tRNA ligase [Candidatus Woesearchaeota archaeon]|nr:proline--tRNA ligase [Candidatus Woesearchaeota archaeon]